MATRDGIHVYPLGDLREHVTVGWPAVRCWCKPTETEEPGGTLIVHHALDRREEYEEGRRLH